MKKNILKYLAVKTAYKAALSNRANRCTYYFYQPEIPQQVKKIKEEKGE